MKELGNPLLAVGLVHSQACAPHLLGEGLASSIWHLHANLAPLFVADLMLVTPGPTSGQGHGLNGT